MFLRSYRVWKVSYFQLTCLSHHQMARVTLPLTLGRGFRSRDSMGSTVSITIYWLLFITDQISNTQKFLKVLCHWIMLHGHENCVEDNTDGDAEVNKWVHDNGVEPLFEPLPTATAVPLQADVSKGVPTWRTRPLVVFKVWNTQQVREMMDSKYLHHQDHLIFVLYRGSLNPSLSKQKFMVQRKRFRFSAVDELEIFLNINTWKCPCEFSSTIGWSYGPQF